MDRLLEIGASNALTVTVFAVLIFALSRLYWKPALVHCLWALLLIKLITPPIIDVPISTARIDRSDFVTADESASGPRIENVAPLEAAAVAGDDQDHLAMEPWMVGRDEEMSPLQSSSDRPMIETGQPAVAAGAPRPTDGDEALTAAPLPYPAPGGQARMLLDSFSVSTLLAGVWLFGCCSIVMMIAVRAARFCRLLRHARPAPPELQRQVERLASQIGLRKAPRVMLLPGVHSPMLWGVRRAAILFPANLLKQIDRRSRETLLLHELAHYRRGDHWLRVLEMVVTAIYWWHPCVWWARREMRAAEEECCDAWVVSQSPENRSVYARALLTVIDSLAGAEVRMPPAASGIGNFQSAKKRLQAIMLGTHQRELGRWGRIAVALVALPCLCLVPTFAQPDEPAADTAPGSSTPTSHKPDSPPKPKGPLPRTIESVDFERFPIALDLRPERIRELSWSSDGKRMAAAYGGRGSTGCLRVWDVAEQKEIFVTAEARGVYSAHISPDGQRVASCSFTDQLIRIHDVKSGELRGQIRTGNKVARVRFSPDGRRLATASTGGLFQLWDVDVVRGGQPADTPLIELASLNLSLQCVAFFPDGKRIAAGGGPWTNKPYGTAGVWDIVTGEQVAKMEGMPNSVLGIAVSPDGRQVATAGHDGLARLWNAETGQLQKVVTRNAEPLESVEFSPDGKRLATGSYDDSATLWNVETGSEEAVLTGHTGDVMSVRFSPDGRQLATGGEDQIIRIWNAADSREVGQLAPAPDGQDVSSAVLAVAASPDGRLIATAHGDRTVRVRDIDRRTVLQQLSGHEDVVTSLAFSPDGATLATGSYDSRVKLWDVQTGAEKQTLAGHESWVMSVAFSPDGKTLASSGYDKTVRLWDVAKGVEREQLTGHSASVRSVAFSPDGRFLATGSSDQTARIWDTETGEHRQTLDKHAGAIRAVAFHPSGAHLATASEDATVRLWDLATGEERAVLQAHQQMVWSLAFSQSGNTLVSGGIGGIAFVWDGETGARRQQILKGHSDIVSGLAFVPHDGSLITVSYDTKINRWMPGAGPLAEIAHRTTGGKAASFVAFTPDGGRVVTTDSASGLCSVWDAQSGRLLRKFRAQGGQIRAAAISPDGQLLAAAQPNKPIRMWDIGAAMMRQELPSTDNIKAMAFSPDGGRLAAAGDDRQARIWDLQSERVIAETPLQGEELHGIAFSPDGKQFVTCSGNWIRSRGGEVKLWDASTATEVARLGGHRGRINAVAFTPDGRRVLAATNQQGLLLIFDVQRQEQSELKLGSPASVLSMALSPDGSRLAVGRSTGEMSLWDLDTRRKLADYAGHEPNPKNSAALVWSLAFSPDGGLLASAGYDEGGRTMRLWPASPTDPIPVTWKTDR